MVKTPVKAKMARATHPKKRNFTPVFCRSNILSGCSLILGNDIRGKKSIPPIQKAALIT